ncbi:MAG TPA: type II toxin-antitoxin system RelE/ParE family toxin [Bryobacteraceae bacterium]|nr:type II toxin-antitoxin system RelE/ParE family toxin [Bryobacteraceae bacterium]
MGHLRTPQADSDLDDIWYYIANNSGSMEVGDRLVDSIAARFILPAILTWDAPATRICGPPCEASQ